MEGQASEPSLVTLDLCDGLNKGEVSSAGSDAGFEQPSLRPLALHLHPCALNLFWPPAQVVVSTVGVTVPGVTPATRHRYLLDAARAVTAGRLHPDKFGVAVRAAGVDTANAAAGELGAALADIVWYAWLEVEGSAGGEEARARCADLVRELLKEQLVGGR